MDFLGLSFVASIRLAAHGAAFLPEVPFDDLLEELCRVGAQRGRVAAVGLLLEDDATRVQPVHDAGLKKQMG